MGKTNHPISRGTDIACTIRWCRRPCTLAYLHFSNPKYLAYVHKIFNLAYINSGGVHKGHYLANIHNGGVHKRHYLANIHNGGVHKRHYLANIHNGGVHKKPYVAYVHSGGVHKTTFRHCVHSGGVNILCHLLVTFIGQRIIEIYTLYHT